MTSFGEEYLCNACLGREPAADAMLRSSASTSEDDDVASKKSRNKYSSVSAPVTPARQNLLTAGTGDHVATYADGLLDMSLLEAQTGEGMQNQLRTDRFS